jgi:hypothetical protein
MEELGCGVVVVVLVIAIATGMSKGCDSSTPPAQQTVTVTKTVPIKGGTDKGTEPIVQPQVVQPMQEVTVETTTKFVPPDFTFGTLAFWILAVAVFVALIPCVEFEYGIIGALCLIIFLGILETLGNTRPLEYLRGNPINIGLCVVAHYLAGVVWGFLKWYMFALDAKFAMFEYKEKWLADNGASDPRNITPEIQAKWARNTTKPSRPLARDNKSKIIHWISFWEVSLAWTVVKALLCDVTKMIFRHIAKSLQRVSDFVWRDVSDQLV